MLYNTTEFIFSKTNTNTINGQREAVSNLLQFFKFKKIKLKIYILGNRKNILLCLREFIEEVFLIDWGLHSLNLQRKVGF